MKARLLTIAIPFLFAGQAVQAEDFLQVQKRLGIPDSVATIVDSSGKKPQYVIIQDIHRHPEAQQNIASMILYGMRHWNTKEIYVEGSWADSDAIQPALTELPSILESVRAGKMGGVEMAVAMAPDQHMRLFGLEDADLYKKNVEAYEAVDHARGDALRELETARLFGRVADTDASQAFITLKRLIQLRLKPTEYAEYLKAPYHATSPSRLADAVASAEHFYQIANDRSRIFLERARALHQSGTQVLVVGGFHTAAMTEELRRHGVSYVVLSPQITEGGFDDLYKRGMHDTISALKLH